MRKLTDKDWEDFQTIWDYLHIDDTLPQHADAIIVGGSGTHTDQAERAAKLWHEKHTPIIIVSGFAHPLFNINEAQILGDKLIEMNVPDSKILRESRAMNSGLNIILSARKLSELRIKPQRIILVHKPYMTRKFLATAEAQWPFSPKPQFFITSVADTFNEYITRDEKLGLAEFDLSAMLRDFESVRDFTETKFGTLQQIPDEVAEAYTRLAKRGFATRTHDEKLSTDKFS